jgi:hypothetical protein
MSKTTRWVAVLAVAFTSITASIQIAVAADEPRPLEQISGRLHTLLDEGRKMEPLRRSDDLDSLRRCTQLRQRLQPEVIALREELKAVSIETGPVHHVRMAASEIQSCVSCSSSALQHCQRAADDLKRAAAK